MIKFWNFRDDPDDDDVNDVVSDDYGEDSDAD
jgi:hypothetical protein